MTSTFILELRKGLGPFLLCFALGVAGPGSGCASKSPKPEPTLAEQDWAELSKGNQALASGTLATVGVQGETLGTVRETVESVFTAAGFAVAAGLPELMVFERPATRRQIATYGSWGGVEVRTRLKVEITPQSGDFYLLRCRSYIVREPGSPSEDEQSLARRHVREYEGLLHEVASRLH